jgi:hypothetical protein
MRLPVRLALTALALCLSQAVPAQWRWVDAEGRVTYSDQPPPPGTTATRVNIRPEPAASAAPATPARPAATQAGNTPAGGSLAEQAAAFEARRREREAAERTAQARQREEETLGRACAQLRESLAKMESGLRMLEDGPDGERRVMDFERRTERAEELRQALRRNCTQG